MNVRNFVTPEELVGISREIQNRQKFEHSREHKGKSGKITVTINSDLVDDKTAKEIWNGNNYLVHFNVTHEGKEIGWGGYGFAMSEFEQFQNWELFKDWFDRQMKRYKNYETEEYGQVSLF